MRVYVKSNSQNPDLDKSFLEQGMDRHISSDKYEHNVSKVRYVRTKDLSMPSEE